MIEQAELNRAFLQDMASRAEPSFFSQKLEPKPSRAEPSFGSDPTLLATVLGNAGSKQRQPSYHKYHQMIYYSHFLPIFIGKMTAVVDYT